MFTLVWRGRHIQRLGDGGAGYANESATNNLLKEANLESNQASNRFQGSLRNAEVVAAMGMSEDIRKRQDALFDSVLTNRQLPARKLACSAAYRNLSGSLCNRCFWD